MALYYKLKPAPGLRVFDPSRLERGHEKLLPEDGCEVRDHRDLRRALKKGDLIPMDEISARIAGVKLPKEQLAPAPAPAPQPQPSSKKGAK